MSPDPATKRPKNPANQQTKSHLTGQPARRAPCYNRMQSLDIDTRGTLEVLAGFIKRFDAPSKIMAASFKNVAQVSHALESGADAVTLSPRLLRAALSAPDIDRAVDDFIKDWKTVYGTTTLP